MAGKAGSDELERGTSALTIARNIRNEIEAGRLADGRQLPSTRELAKQWNTSVATISRAMGILADEGLVENRPRSSRLVTYPAGQREPGLRRPPKVVLIGGHAGSGKTELGRILARLTGWTIIDKDTTTRPVVEAALEKLGQSPHDRESELYLTVVRPAEYEALIAGVTENVICGNSAIATAPFVREFGDQAWCERLAANLASLGAELHVVWVRCDLDTMRSYIRHRGAGRDTWKLTHWDEWVSIIDLEFRPVIAHQVIDNSKEARPLQQQAKDLLEKVSSR